MRNFIVQTNLDISREKSIITNKCISRLFNYLVDCLGLLNFFIKFRSIIVIILTREVSKYQKLVESQKFKRLTKSNLNT